MFRKVTKYFITGVALILPPAITIFFLNYLYQSLKEYARFQYAELAIISVLLFIVFIGYLAVTTIGENLFHFFDTWMSKIPLIGLVYKSTKDVTTAFVGTDNKFSEPVLIEYAKDIYKIGFVTNRDLGKILLSNASADDENLIAVYVPISFSIAGDLFLVSKNKIRPMDAKANLVMQTIVSGGLIKVE